MKLVMKTSKSFMLPQRFFSNGSKASACSFICGRIPNHSRHNSQDRFEMFDFTSAMRMLAFFVAAHFVASSDDTFGQKFPELCEQWNVMKNETCQCLSLQSDEVKNLVANCTSEVLKKENAKFVDVIEEACKHADDPFSHYLPFDTCMHPKMVSLMAENQSGPIAESSEAFQECLQRLLKKYNVIEAL